MIYLHETHEVIGGKMDAFEHALREQWLPLMQRDGDAKLRWCWHHTHGTGPSYQVITITAVRDWAAWGRLVEASQHDAGWRDWYASVWQSRREVVSKVLLPTEWSPLQTIDFSANDSSEDQATSLYLHDTGWPYVGRLDDYTAALGRIYYPAVKQSRMISVDACWTVCPGTGRFHEVVLLQRVLDWPAFSHLLTAGERPSRPGDWMQEGLKYRDRWESKLLRPAAWSPLR